MPAVWESRFAELVRRLTAGRESTELELINDLMPVMPVCDPQAAEMPLVRRERRFSAYNYAAAVAGQQGYCVISNYADSGVLVVLEEILPWVAAGSTTLDGRMFDAASLAGGIVRGVPMDMRGVPNVTTANWSRAETRNNTAAAVIGTQFWLGEVRATGSVVSWPMPVVLRPNSSVAFWCGTANLAMGMTFRWRERAVDASELNPSGA